jgi:hypothetical protein
LAEGKRRKSDEHVEASLLYLVKQKSDAVATDHVFPPSWRACKHTREENRTRTIHFPSLPGRLVFLRPAGDDSA